MKIAFYCDINLNNYLTHPFEYKYLHGRHSATGYYYWILKNNNINNIYLVNNASDLSNYDVVVFHYDNYQDIRSLNCKKIQIVTDRPMIESCNLYIMANKSFFVNNYNLNLIKRYGIENSLNTWLKNKENIHFIHYPPTFGVKICTPNFPPKKFKFVGRKHTNIKEIQEYKFIQLCEKYDIFLEFDYINDGNSGDEDVYFCIRNVTDKCKVTGKDNNSGKYGHRTANRLYQSWYMNTPGIFNISPEMEAIKTNELDYLMANNCEEFLEQAIKLKNNKDLFYSIIDNGNSKKHLNPYINYDIIIDQWMEAFNKINIKI